jgi:hypothetical protein
MRNKPLVKAIWVMILANIALAACRPTFSTPHEALTAFPGYLVSSDYYDSESVQMAQEQPAPGGKVLVYYWRVKEESVCHLSITYVSQELFGWQAQSSGDTLVDCELAQLSDWETAALVGGNIRPLTAVYGVSPKGVAVRVTWPDGDSAIAPITDGVFVQTRAGQFTAWHLELLDEAGAVVESRDVDLTR